MRRKIFANGIVWSVAPSGGHKYEPIRTAIGTEFVTMKVYVWKKTPKNKNT